MRRATVMTAVLAIAGCGGLATLAPETSADFTFGFDDPAGDTVVVDSPTVQAIDAIRIEGTLAGTMMEVRLKFANQVTPWSEQKSNGLDGYIDFDLDREGNQFVGTVDSTMGVDMYLDLRDNGGGKVALIEPAKHLYTLVDAQFSGSEVRIQFPRNKIPAEDSGFYMAAEIGIRGRPRTDILPDSGHYLIQRPVP